MILRNIFQLDMFLIIFPEVSVNFSVTIINLELKTSQLSQTILNQDKIVFIFSIVR